MALTKKAPKNSAGLHQFIAKGGKPSAYKGTKGAMPPKMAPKKK